MSPKRGSVRKAVTNCCSCMSRSRTMGVIHVYCILHTICIFKQVATEATPFTNRSDHVLACVLDVFFGEMLLVPIRSGIVPLRSPLSGGTRQNRFVIITAKRQRIIPLCIVTDAEKLSTRLLVDALSSTTAAFLDSSPVMLLISFHEPEMKDRRKLSNGQFYP